MGKGEAERTGGQCMGNERGRGCQRGLRGQAIHTKTRYPNIGTWCSGKVSVRDQPPHNMSI